MKTLYFTSRREGSTGGKKDEKGLYYEDVYFSNLGNDGHWSPAKHIGGKINTVGHEATISISPDGKTILLYKDDKGDGNIYYSELLNDNEWSKPEKMPEPINSSYWETHACYSPDMNIIYFVSNRPGGFGGRDIWMTEKINGKWMEVENLGSTINTQYDEDSPYMLPDGYTLYFSSQGHDNMGGFDIFISTRTEDGFWTTPENMGYPVNTTEDDVFYIPTPDEKHAFYSSAKNYGMGGQDIYYMTIVKAKKKTIKLRGRVADANSFKALEANIEFFSKTKEMVMTNLTSAEDGSYVTTLLLGDEYEIKVKADGYKMATYDLAVLEDERRDELVLDMFLSKLLLAGDTAKAHIEDIRVGEKIVLNNIFYDFDRATLRPESVEELNRLIKLMKDIPSLKIELSSHTDNVGSDEYNMKLSKERAQSVVSFLEASGIAADRLVAKGYGETQPITTNTTEEGRQANRRTEFKILSK
jgi:outer membrane protein OmpA-like peptidoglycan-associated protein